MAAEANDAPLPLELTKEAERKLDWAPPKRRPRPACH
jgi:hypothetical protein